MHPTPVKISFHQMAISLVFPNGNSFTFDPSGRPIRLAFGQRHFIRGLDGVMKEKAWDPSLKELGRRVRTLKPKYANSQLNRMYALIHQLGTRPKPFSFHATKTGFRGGFDSAEKILRLLRQWTPKRLLQHATRFHQVYTPVNILPPDQYFSVIIQIAEGCPWNRCTFCHFYKGRTYRPKSLGEIQKHIKDVRTFLGESIHLRKSIFLSDANALAMPTTRLRRIMRLMKTTFPDQTGPDGGIFSFGDVPTILNISQHDLKSLAKSGLRKVYIGLESGSNPIRRQLNKPASGRDAVEAVRKLKRAGLRVGIIVLLADFARNNASHIQDTIHVVRGMKLSKGDVLFFSPFVDKRFPNRPLSRIAQQWRAIRSRIQLPSPPAGPVQAVYDIREFVI